MNRFKLGLWRALTLCSLIAVAVEAQDNVVISEFMANNTSKNPRPVRDEDGDYSDWIEIYNAGTNTVNLLDWKLRDSNNEWEFPETNINPSAFILVFASDKDRAIPGRELHANFQLSSSGEYLALVKPDGTNIVTEFDEYPAQVANISYGLSQTALPTKVVSNLTPARVLVPADGSLGLTWTETGFPHGGWQNGTNGVGFDTGDAQPGEPFGVLAHEYTFDGDNANDSAGTMHGAELNSPTYATGRGAGRALSLNGIDQAIDFPSNNFTGTFTLAVWARPTRKGSIQMLLANSRSGFTSNGFRFYINDLNTTNGIITFETGNGVSSATTKSHTAVDFDQWNHLAVTVERAAATARIYKNGADVTSTTTRSLRTDFATNATWRIGQSLSSSNSFSGLIDQCTLWLGKLELSQIAALARDVPAANMTVFGPLIRTDIRNVMHNVNASAFVRLPFNLDNVSAITGLKLRMRHDDGFVAYVNGVESARRNAPSFAVGGTVADSVADFSGIQGQGGWFYGYYVKSADPDGIYQPANFNAFPVGAGPWSSTNYWTGTMWDWFAGNPPWTELNANGGHPNGLNTGPDHWAIRRWVSDVTGNLNLALRVAKANTGGGNGITARVIHNGVQRYARSIAGTDGVGVTTNITLSDVIAGDTVDFVIDSAGANGISDDGSDGSIFTIRLEQLASPPLEWNSTALATRPNAQGVQFEEIDIFGAIRWLQAGQNIVAIHGLNSAAANSDFFIEAELEASVASAISVDTQRYFVSSTPGGVNGVGLSDLGPIILDVSHYPAVPLENEDIYVTARIEPSFANIVTNQLIYRVMFQPEVTVPLWDDGLHGDGAVGDGVFGAIIPSSISTNGQMVRWFIRSFDLNNRTSRWPLFHDPNNSAQYLGTIVHLEQTNNLSILHWFVENPSAAATAAGTRCSLFYLNRFYDNCYINIHGQSSSGGDFLRKAYDIDFNPGEHFLWKEGEVPVDDINFLQTYSDKAKMRNMLVYDTHKDAGAPYHFVVPARVQQNGVYYADYHIVENGDAGFLERNGRDPNGALYKMYNTFTSPGHATPGTQAAEKKTRKNEGGADLLELYNGVSGATRNVYIWDTINIPEVLNSVAARTLTGDIDCCHKNYYFYRDTEGTGEWEAMSWDVDLSFGRNWGDCSNYWSDLMHPENRAFVGENNSFFNALFANPTSRQMYFRRFRTLMDELLQPPGTPVEELKYERQIDEWVALIAPDAELEKYRWATWGSCASPNVCCTQSVAFAANRIKAEFLAPRRTMLANRTGIQYSAEVPNAQPTNVVINFAGVDFNPASSNQAEEYIQLRNTNLIAVDISGWQLTGAVQHVFQSGAVIPANSSVYVVPNKRAFRGRAIAPRAGMSLYVEGEYEGQLNARGESLFLTDNRGRPVANTNYPGNPSPEQLYLRITEIMYAPAPPLDTTYDAEDFEYIELKNIGPVTLSLLGVHFTNGIDFQFTGSAVTSLNAGQSVLVVKNLAAFTARYGTGFNIAGTYGGQLDNGGERLRLDDVKGEKILEFSYNNNWYPITDGLGFSLVIVDENAAWNTWGRKESWRPSSGESGSPGQNDPPASNIAPILINEVVSNSENPPQDRIELYNPTASDVNIGGWFLSDDFRTPRKYRIANGTTIPAGGYIVFNETNFNPNPLFPTSFAFSSAGDEAFLFSGNANTNLTGYFHGFRFGGADPDVSFGRFVTSDTNEHFVAQSQVTINGTNAYPRIGPVLITEIMYHPPDRANGQDDQDAEYIELHNPGATNVALFDADNPLSTWRVRGGVDFDFPLGVTLAPGEYALLVSFNPTNASKTAAFRSHYGLSPAIDLYGPYSGKLDNSADAVSLQKPGQPVGNEVPHIVVERVDYRDVAPWPAAADGAGPSLQRFNLSGFANEPTNWGGAFSPGAGQGGTPPQITSHPVSQTVLAGTNITLSVSANGTEPLAYQWRFNGVNIFGANSATLPLNDVKASQAGGYNAVVFNPAGSAVSSTGHVAVIIPLKIIGQPAPRNVLPGASTNFSVNVSSPRPVTYQWRRNGDDIPNATNAVLTITNAQREIEGDYQVFVQDAVSSELSQPARLVVLFRPFFSLLPVSQTLALGSTAIFNTAISNTANLPVTNRWRKGGAFIRTNILNVFVDSLVLSNITTNDGDAYTCLWGNIAGSTALSQPSALLVVVDPPTNQTVAAGADVTFTTLAYMRSANPPIRYQWQFGGVNIVNATNTTLSVTNVQADDAGTYTALVINSQGMATPFSAQLSITSDSARFFDTQLAGDGSFRAMIEGSLNETYSIEVSVDLTNWTELRSLVMTNAAVLFSDPDATNAPQRFYRARLAD